MVTAIVQQRRDEISAIRTELVGTRVGYSRTKNGKAAALDGVRDQRVQLESNLDALEAASRRFTSQLQEAQRRNNPPDRVPHRSSAAVDAWSY